jgi:hypothetical protein
MKSSAVITTSNGLSTTAPSCGDVMDTVAVWETSVTLAAGEILGGTLAVSSSEHRDAGKTTTTATDTAALAKDRRVRARSRPR